ncbi:MAG: DNA-directed RNA polymerase subunit E'' [Candidatus Aenigmarchaeota archaeon]|nr:DNA-directed RNA polymerase subunit E'' [Candidatus Aenigmarchaeota archaeon]MCK5176678.1 DNA-directed RNA polymerase subunit E'' [Candidatus Aenigmarchaeota archaeon]
MLRACSICRRLTEKRECDVCKNKDLSEEWSGLVVIANPKESMISQKLDIQTSGMYAQYVRSL